MFCGPPYSGKSTLARRIWALQPAKWVIISREPRTNCPVVQAPTSNVKARTKTGAQLVRGRQNDFKRLLLETLKINVSLILDACHSTKKTRQNLMALIPKGFWKIVIVIDLPLPTILARERGALPLMSVCKQRAWEQFHGEKPDVEELRKLGFNQIFFLTEF